MVVATWNLAQRSPHGEYGRLQRDVLTELGADVLLLTEVRADFSLPGYHLQRSEPRALAKRPMSWCAIATSEPIEQVPTDTPGFTAGWSAQLGWALACSVLPWRGAGDHWPGDPGQPLAERFAQTLQSHVDQLPTARPLLWGGDFNQALTGPEGAGTRDGRVLLRRVTAELGLSSPTTALESLAAPHKAIDHVFVPDPTTRAERQVPLTSTGRPASDHPLYVLAPVSRGEAPPPAAHRPPP